MSSDPDPMLAATHYVDHHHPAIRTVVASLGPPDAQPDDYARAVFEFVRDQVPHTSDTGRQVVTVTASQVLAERTGICHARSNLLAALLRARGIPAGFGFQHLTLSDDESEGYCLHAFVMVRLGDRWVPLDPRAGTPFDLESPRLPIACRDEFDEYVLPGIWAEPDAGTMSVLEQSTCLDDALAKLPDRPTVAPAEL